MMFRMFYDVLKLLAFQTPSNWLILQYCNHFLNWCWVISCRRFWCVFLFCQVEPPTQSFEKPSQASSGASFERCLFRCSQDFWQFSFHMPQDGTMKRRIILDFWHVVLNTVLRIATVDVGSTEKTQTLCHLTRSRWLWNPLARLSPDRCHFAESSSKNIAKRFIMFF